jgi:hypothetical protein
MQYHSLLPREHGPFQGMATVMPVMTTTNSTNTVSAFTSDSLGLT